MKNKKDSRWQMVLLIVCLCFFIGIVIGAFSLTETDSEKINRLAELVNGKTAECGSFGGLYVKHIKYILAMWFSAFLGSGGAFILVIIFSIGIMYGFSTAFAAARNGISGLYGILPQNLIFLPVYIFMAVWSVNFVLNSFTDFGPKSRLKREREKHVTEHIIILLLCMVLTVTGCLCELHTSYVSF